MNFTDRIVRSQLELTKPIADGTGIDASRAFQDKIGKLMHFTRRRDVVVHDELVEEMHGALIVPRDEIRSGMILYLHGGGYIAGTLEYAKGFGAVLSAECGMKVFAAEYRLAPENPYPAALDDAEAAYMQILDSGIPPEKIVLAGESAGGGLCYALCLRLRERGLPMPSSIITVSPWLDLTLSGDSYHHNKEADPSLTPERLEFFANCYVGEEKYERGASAKRTRRTAERTGRAEALMLKQCPEVSPLFASLEGMPPSLILVGGDEIMLSDSVAMHERLLEAGCDASIVVRPNMWHAYLLYSLKSSKDDFDTINKFLKRTLPHGAERKLRWMHLDNSGKIYPAAATSTWINIHRLSATLTEEVDKEVLQSALDVTVRRFPSIAVRLRAGAFWYYLEEIAHAPRVMDERHQPLIRMPFDDIRKCAFRVLVYRRRIAVEFFHALTDGNGGLVFLKTLVAEYLTQKYGIKIPCEYGVLDRLEEPSEDELEDNFPKYKAKVGKSRRESDSYRIYGTPEERDLCHVTTLIMRPGELLELAHSYGVTLTALLAAMFIRATIALQNIDTPRVKRQKKVKVLVPCDLRRLYGSRTLRNFVLYSTPGVDPRLGEYSLEELCNIVHHKMSLDITKKNMSARIYTNVKDEENMALKLAPLFLKNIVMKLVFLAVGEKKSTLSVSNLGAAKLPEEMKPYVKELDFILSVQQHAPYNAGIISYGDELRMNIIRNIKEPRLEMALYRVLRECGIHVKVQSNDGSLEGGK
ncbi:MAG: alpha/beta hydrolase fold domain-containing protein [Clostridia bacterium]|nr:alpha/beta hydrolase fold domain-containing protein [Clostridia bacterium]